ncbi:OmpA family protein [Halopseudomonas phragmitis]|uniref:OmpA family protein n=1 Tax=Halopseudomonas phragmitis TaxID=1931241 RepID=UPI001C4779A9|nr:OmpA family protein [Halopseudomonas phragmitis]
MLPRYLTLALIASLAATGASADDHPLLSRFPGAQLKGHESIAYEHVALPQAAADAPDTEPLVLVGDLSRHTYEIGNVSTLKVWENYQAALQRAGFEILFQCEREACGPGRDVKRMADPLAVSGNVYNFYRNPYYLLTRQDNIHLALFIGGHNDRVSVQQVIVETVARDTDLISLDSDYLNQADDSALPEISAEQRAEDHPLLSRYPGARVRNRERRDYEQFILPVPPGSAAEPLPLVGDLTRHFYEVRNVSTLKLWDNYQAALESGGFELLWQCQRDACGNQRERKALGDRLSLEGNVYNYHSAPYYAVYQRDGSQGPVHVALYIGGHADRAAIQQVVIEGRGRADDLIQVNAEGLYRDLQEAGKALIYGIHFDTDSAAIKPESAPTLQAIAELLGQHPALRLYVVGHTDDTGSEQHNLRLSSARAEAVVKALSSDYAVAANRLQSAGVGPYAPAAGNLDEAGRQRNRRVELVQRLP